MAEANDSTTTPTGDESTLTPEERGARARGQFVFETIRGLWEGLLREGDPAFRARYAEQLDEVYAVLQGARSPAHDFRIRFLHAVALAAKADPRDDVARFVREMLLVPYPDFAARLNSFKVKRAVEAWRSETHEWVRAFDAVRDADKSCPSANSLKQLWTDKR